MQNHIDNETADFFSYVFNDFSEVSVTEGNQLTL